MIARRSSTATSRLVVAVAAAGLALQGCSSGGGSAADPLRPIRTIPIAYNVIGVAGHGLVVATLHYESSFTAALRLARQDATAPTELVDLGDLRVGGVTVNPVDDFTVTADWVTLSSGGMTAAISLTTLAPEVVGVFSTGQGTRALASGRWLLSAHADALTVRDLASPGQPQVGAEIPAGAPVTGLAEALDGFYVFTSSGFGHVSMQGNVPAYQHASANTLRMFAKAYLHGTKLYVGGPSPYVGKVRVARVDVSAPAAPAVEASADVDATWGDFAYDGAGGYAVLGEDASDWGKYGLVVLRESEGAIVPGAAHEVAILRHDASNSHASRGLLYVPAFDSNASTSGDLAIYTLP